MIKSVHYYELGCPAPTVNRHGGGAMLLDDPGLLFRIVSSVRQAVPARIPVSAKMRLGIGDTAKALDCARALSDGGIASLVVHARTRDEGYRPPAHWDWIARIRESVSVPVVANGEIWTPEDYVQCRAVSGCADVMIGRGAVSDPFLARRIKTQVLAGADRSVDWDELKPLLGEFWRQVQTRVVATHAPGRLKLWLNALRRTFGEAEALYWSIRPLRDVDDVERALASSGVAVDADELVRVA